MRHHCCRFSSIPACVCLDWGQKVWLCLSPASFIFESAWGYSAAKIHKQQPKFIASLTLLIFSLISHHTPSSDPIRFFSTLHTFPGSKREWSVNIYQHDLWFVNRFADKMLIFQTSRLNSFQTKTKLCCKANMRNKLFHGNTTRFIFMSHPSALSTHRTVLFTYHP